MKEFERTERIGAELRRELVAILRDEVRDPRLQRVTLQTVAGSSQGTVDYLRGECLFRIGRLDEAREALDNLLQNAGGQ